MLDPKVVENLKKYEKYEKCTCLECGYEGMMGVGEPTMRAGIRIPFFIVVTAIVLGIIIFSDGGVLTIVLTLAAEGFVFAKFDKHYLYCPNCERKLKRR